MKRVNLISLNFLNIIRFSLFFFLILSSSAIIYSTYRNFQAVQLLADQALRNTAIALSSTAELALRRQQNKSDSEIQDIFSDRVVAYALIADDKGKILFHTNPKRKGSFLAFEEMVTMKAAQKSSGRRIFLGTGLPAYEFNRPLHLANNTVEWLRIIIHTTPADQVIANARIMWWIGLSVLLLLWIVGILFERVLTHSLKLRDELNHKKHLALIGQMTALLAHEIRNALGSVKGYAQLVYEKLKPEDSKKTAIASVLQGTARIEFLVQELLEFSREERFILKRIDVMSLLKNVISSTLSGWNGKWKITETREAFVNADEEKLRRVFINGVQNAIQAMGEDGFLLVSIQQTGRWIEIKIEDSGPGISSEQEAFLFTPFYTTKAKGTGLGLAYSKKVIEGMNGKIELGNRSHAKGAVLIIHIPEAGEE